MGQSAFIDSSGVGAYVTAFRRARAQGTQLTVGLRSPLVQRVLELSGVEEALAAEATSITDDMFLAAADVLAEAVTTRRFAEGALYPPVDHLRGISRRIAVAVAEEARRAGFSGLTADVSSDEAVDQAIWEPDYVNYIVERAAVPS